MGKGITILALLALLGLAGAYFGGLFEGPPGLPPLPSIEVTTPDPAIAAQVAAARARVEADPHDARANGDLGSLYELYQRPEGARAAYQRAADLAPDELRWAYHLGRVEKAWGDAAAARASLERAVTLDPSYVPAVALLGEVELEAGDLDAAQERFREILRRRPRSCSGLLGLGQVLAERGDHPAALEFYTQALAVAPAHAPLHYAAGISRRATGRPDLAQKHFEFARENGPANPQPDPLLAEVMQLEIGIERDYREAKRQLDANRPTDAIPLLRAVLRLDPRRMAAQGYLARALMMIDDDTALHEYERAVDLNPTNIDFLRPYSLLLLRAGHASEAEKHIREVIRLGGDHYDDHHVLGLALMKLERPLEADAEFRLTLERKPDHAEALRMRETIRAQGDGG